MAKWNPELKGASCIRKLDKPILTKNDIPYTAEFIVVTPDDKLIKTVISGEIFEG